MSGSDGGTGGILGGGSGGEQVCCELISTQTVINSPDPGVISGLEQGMSLSVVQQGDSLVAVDTPGNVAGSLTPPNMHSILECMGQGHQYIAVVNRVEGGRCVVRIVAGTH